MKRRRAVGAEVVPDDGAGVHFRVWAPAHESVAVVIGEREIPLEREDHGYHSALVPGARDGTLYRFRLGGDLFPDPASRFQPGGPHGPSRVVDPSAYTWRDGGWRGIEPKGRILYEIHVGTFTREGTYAAAAQHLDHLAETGINTIELMPLHEFPGAFGWGYDGVDLWAPSRLYGEPDELRRFVDAAHAHEIAVILDVVYNHFGPDGCYISKFSPDYFTDKYENDWGQSINFDGEHAAAVRQFFIENAAHWIDEYHFDGLRLDATQSIDDASEPHILREITDRARAAAGDRPIYLVAENEPQDTRLLREYGVDAMWNDDWHHSARVAATGFAEAYYSDHRGRPQEFVSQAKHGFLYQGQHYSWQKNRRGTPSHDIAPERLVCFFLNHDQLANSQHGERIWSRPLTALLLLQPQTPMLFQGQELGAKTPFLYFADHKPELAKLVRNGRADFMSQFPSIDLDALPVPDDRATFEACKLDHENRDEEVLRVHRELLALRRERPFVEQRSDWLFGTVLGERCFALRWLTGGADDRLLLVNLDKAFDYAPAAEPLLAPPEGFTRWDVRWGVERFEKWRIPAESAVVLAPG